jgi:hypothetical protein
MGAEQAGGHAGQASKPLWLPCCVTGCRALTSNTRFHASLCSFSSNKGRCWKYTTPAVFHACSTLSPCQMCIAAMVRRLLQRQQQHE